MKTITDNGGDVRPEAIVAAGHAGCVVATTWDIVPEDYRKANAQLIAAAPELLESLMSYLRAPSVGSDGPGSSTIVIQEYNRRAAREAVDKATGKADTE